MTALNAPFPWFGGKSRVAPAVWARFGDVNNYVEPFFGSGAVLLARPPLHTGYIETVNDLDGYVANFWRALQADPAAVARWVDWPVNENDLHARHIWLVKRREELSSRLEGDPDYYDARIAGYWVWGLSSWIGSGWCSGNGSWAVDGDGRLVAGASIGMGVHRRRVHLGDSGMGVHRKLVHLGDSGMGVHRKRLNLGNDSGTRTTDLYAYMSRLAQRLRRVRVACGDWSRVCGPTPTFKLGVTGVFLDPPYSAEADRSELYSEENFTVAHDVREWAIANGDNPLMRIALCGYEGEHEMPDEWECVAWKARDGYAGQRINGVNDNAHRERVWFSPHCMRTDEITFGLFAGGRT